MPVVFTVHEQLGYFHTKYLGKLTDREVLDAPVCDDYKKEHFFAFHGGHNCGICTSACPYGHKLLKASQAE